jgi:hypothetical protein
MLARLAGAGAGARPTRGGDVVPWHAITQLNEGQITIRD